MEKKTEEILKGIYDSLTEEQKEKAKDCKTMDDWMAFLEKEGLELPDEMLDAVAGGQHVELEHCPHYGQAAECQ